MDSTNNTKGIIALISSNAATIDGIARALEGIYAVEVFSNGMSLHFAMQNNHRYQAIISADDLRGSSGAPLLTTLSSLGYQAIPFIAVIKQIDDEQRRFAMQSGIAELFAEPLDEKAVRIRVPFIIENFLQKDLSNNSNKPFRLPFIKRVFDVFFSGMALLCLSPLFLLIAILIRLESKGKVFYYSLRVGTGYQVFKFYKFRSMFTGADAKLKDLSHLNQYNIDNAAQEKPRGPVRELCDLCEQSGTICQNALFSDDKIICEKLFKQQQASKIDSAFIKIKDDPRITRVGKFIRNTSIDELPQLWNVFIGDMSIVGNRPLPLYEAEKITTDKYALRFMAPAGITGLWQVEKRGRGEMSEEERLSLDNNYARSHSFMNDIRLILRTIPALFQSENV
ncbi:MAG: hypothetical protein RLZZ28_1878 [Bacteroidota bacterium]|jgi:lipopolysaccharide/colanic/teichoic acid biosynthesis glycosyltransferase